MSSLWNYIKTLQKISKCIKNIYEIQSCIKPEVRQPNRRNCDSDLHHLMRRLVKSLLINILSSLFLICFIETYKQICNSSIHCNIDNIHDNMWTLMNKLCGKYQWQLPIIVKFIGKLQMLMFDTLIICTYVTSRIHTPCFPNM